MLSNTRLYVASILKMARAIPYLGVLSLCIIGYPPSQFERMQETTTLQPQVVISHGGASQYVRDSYGDVASIILARINKYHAGHVTEFTDIQSFLTQSGYEDLSALCRNQKPFVDQRRIDAIISYNQELVEVRSIPIVIKAKDGGKSIRKYIVLSFNQKSPPQLELITYDEIALYQLTNYSMKNGDSSHSVYETVTRFCEFLEQSYNTKDIESLRNVYADTASIIVGRELHSFRESEFLLRSKNGYLQRLKEIFDKEEHISVSFDSLSIKKEGNNRFIVQVYQRWTSDKYSDYSWILFDVEIGMNENAVILKRISFPSKSFAVKR